MISIFPVRTPLNPREVSTCPSHIAGMWPSKDTRYMTLYLVPKDVLVHSSILLLSEK